MFGSFPSEPWLVWQSPKSTRVDGSRHCYGINEKESRVVDFGARHLAVTAAQDLLEIVMRRHERASILLTSNRPVDDWGKLLGDSAAVTAMLDRIHRRPSGQFAEARQSSVRSQSYRRAVPKLQVLSRAASRPSSLPQSCRKK
jgi:hypothetical protein